MRRRAVRQLPDLRWNQSERQTRAGRIHRRSRRFDDRVSGSFEIDGRKAEAGGYRWIQSGTALLYRLGNDLGHEPARRVGTAAGAFGSASALEIPRERTAFEPAGICGSIWL